MHTRRGYLFKNAHQENCFFLHWTQGEIISLTVHTRRTFTSGALLEKFFQQCTQGEIICLKVHIRRAYFLLKCAPGKVFSHSAQFFLSAHTRKHYLFISAHQEKLFFLSVYTRRSSFLTVYTRRSSFLTVHTRRKLFIGVYGHKKIY